MTRKDYVLIAAAMHNAKPDRKEMLALSPACVAWLACVTNLAHKLSADNARFDSARFMAACGDFGEAAL